MAAVPHLLLVSEDDLPAGLLSRGQRVGDRAPDSPGAWRCFQLPNRPCMQRHLDIGVC